MPDWADDDGGSPGYVGIDLVSHDGGNPRGEFCFTLAVTDIATGWAENRTGQGSGPVARPGRDLRRAVQDRMDAETRHRFGSAGSHGPATSTTPPAHLGALVQHRTARTSPRPTPTARTRSRLLRSDSLRPDGRSRNDECRDPLWFRIAVKGPSGPIRFREPQPNVEQHWADWTPAFDRLDSPICPYHPLS